MHSNEMQNLVVFAIIAALFLSRCGGPPADSVVNL